MTRFLAILTLLAAGFVNAAPAKVRTYSATVIRVVDGDTFVCEAELGLGVSRRVTVRVLDIDAPELRDRPAGPDAKAFTQEWLAKGGSLEIVTDDDGVDSFGRVLARVYRADGRSLGADLLDAGHAVPYRKN
jgi:micrococcal nuclease